MMPFFRDVAACVRAACPSHLPRQSCSTTIGFPHRYAFTLHADEPHPHVHLVLKAVSEQGVRLNIKKATLRHWRSEFARNLRLLGIEANATERAVRGETRKAKKDGIHRAGLRGDSTYLRAQAEAVAAELLKSNASAEPGKRNWSRPGRR
jgi:type IV secretion system T-DNA border endonuclease VirD2